jgi:hypothetical protein
MDAAHVSKKMARAIAGTPQWDYLVKIKTDKSTLYQQAREITSPVLGHLPRDVMTARKHRSCSPAERRRK